MKLHLSILGFIMERNAERFGKDDTRRQIRGRVDKALRGEPTEEILYAVRSFRHLEAAYTACLYHL